MLTSSPARAENAGGPPRETVLLLPTLTPLGDDGAGTALRAPTLADGEVRARADELDATLREAIEDSGFDLAIPDADELARGLRDASLVARAGKGEHGRWVLSPRLERDGTRWRLRVVAVGPREVELRVRLDETLAIDIPARALVLLRPLLLDAVNRVDKSSQSHASQPSHQTRSVSPASSGPVPAAAGVLAPAHTSGRMVLAVHGAAFGAFTGYAVERSSGSGDSRLLFPLLALGASVGAGAAILSSDEWNLPSDHAWALGTSLIAGTASGYALGRQYNDGNTAHRPLAYGVAGGLAGAAVGITVLTQSSRPNVAPVLGSGAFLGALTGGLAARLVDGRLSGPSARGVGEGLAVGLVGAGVLAIVATTADLTRLGNLDLGAGLGALLGAAAGTPFLLEPKSASNDRLFLACTAGGMIGGAVLGWWLAPVSGGSRVAAAARNVTFVPLLGEASGVGIFGVF